MPFVVPKLYLVTYVFSCDLMIWNAAHIFMVPVAPEVLCKLVLSHVEELIWLLLSVSPCKIDFSNSKNGINRFVQAIPSTKFLKIV